MLIPYKLNIQMVYIHVKFLWLQNYFYFIFPLSLECAQLKGSTQKVYRVTLLEPTFAKCHRKRLKSKKIGPLSSIMQTSILSVSTGNRSDLIWTELE